MRTHIPSGVEEDEDFSSPPGNLPVRRSHRLSDQLVEDTREAFQKRTGRKLTTEDARQILENLLGFFTVLHDWEREASEREAGNDAIDRSR